MEEQVMKISKIAKTLTLGIGLLVATTALAANKGTMKLFDAASVGGKQIPAGEYAVTWEGNGPTVDVKVMKGSKVVATTPAQLVDLKRMPDNDGTTTKSNGGQGPTVTQIFFRGKSQALALDSNGVEAAEKK